MTDTGSEAQSDRADTGSSAGYALGDQATSIDSLGFTPYVEAIARFLTSEATKPPLTVSIEGEWGSGKSSFLLQLENAIGGTRTRTPLWARLPPWLGGLGAPPPPPRPSSALCVRFNAWRHDKQDALWAAFALAFVKSLRAEVGLVRAWRGDILLLLKRLNGARAWFQLGLLLVSALALVIGLFEVWSLVTTHPTEVRQLLDWLVKIEPEPDEKAKVAAAIPGASKLRLLASSGTFGTLAALGLAGLYKFHAAIKMPLSLKLEKYISKPDYEGHASFIEDFHRDLNRLVEAYAGRRRVFIFIDDLDRCDVPRAADLMQAINLMIGDSRNLVFIMGMDREKVAAGITQKYSQILPFLRETAHWKPNDEKDNHIPLYFGYGYLEKFIQISFTLPVAAGEKALEGFFLDETAPTPQPGWRSRLWRYWAARFAPAPGPMSAPQAIAADRIAQSASTSPERVAERRFNRLKMEQESERIRKIVGIVSALFEYNPRRIKQFINTFRLALYIASDLGLFDEEETQAPPATPEQIGKFVALLLRFPDLRFDLELDPRLLGKLQVAALTNPEGTPSAYHWLNKPGAADLLRFGCKPDTSSGPYSLADFDISRLFSVLPRAARPPEISEAVDAQVNVQIPVFDALAQQYEAIRREERGSPERTHKMTDVAEQALRGARRLSPGSATRALAQLAAGDQPGRRLMRILIAGVHRDPANLEWLLGYNRKFVSPFEHYWCIQTLIDYVPLMTEADRARVNADLNRHTRAIAADPGRVESARHLRNLTSPGPASKTENYPAPTAAAPKTPPTKAAVRKSSVPTPTSAAPPATSKAAPAKPAARKKVAASPTKSKRK